MQRKSIRSYGFGLLVLAAGGCAGAENISDPPPTPSAGQGVNVDPATAGRSALPQGRAQPANNPTTVTPPITASAPDVPPVMTSPGFVPFPSAGGTCAVMGGFAGGPLTEQLARATVRATTPPPPISGGTMLTTRDGTLLVAADPERDQLYFVDIKTSKLLHTRQLLAQDEPGRVLEDAQGRIHVVLRGGKGIASLTRDAQSTITRREVCSVPRGIAYDAAHDQLHVACAEGRLVSLGAAPSGAITRQVEIAGDARDVIARGDQLFVSHFRSAELEVLDANGKRMQSVKPETFSREELAFVPLDDAQQPNGVKDACGGGVAVQQVMRHVESEPSVAWRAIDVPNQGVTMLHQRARKDEVQVTQGGYGSGTCGSGIVQTSISVGLDKPKAVSADLESLALAVDMATDPDGEILAIVAPGNHGIQGQISVLPITNLMSLLTQNNPQLDAKGFPGGALPEPGSNPSVPAIEPGPMMPVGMTGPSTSPCLFSGSSLPDPVGQATALSFTSPYTLAVFQRDPAAISIYDLRTDSLQTHIDLQQAATTDTGHTIFHVRAGAGVACASCHPEAGDDGHTWTFHGIGARRSQTLRGGLLGTEPFHWNGDMADFNMLVTEVFVGRMSGFQPRPDQSEALIGWLDKQPALHADARDPLAAERGKTLFESKDVGCAECHAGTHRTNNQTRNVGTGADLQVPALKGLLFRTPLMHDGCAPTIQARFTDLKCGGGSSHGHVSQLSNAQLGDLTAYLETL